MPGLHRLGACTGQGTEVCLLLASDRNKATMTDLCNCGAMPGQQEVGVCEVQEGAGEMQGGKRRTQLVGSWQLTCKAVTDK